MKEIDDNKVKEILVDALKKFDEICNKYNLKYSIAYGTLIGAVRHKGFIPWDDDIDVIMPRDDYEKLLDLKYDDGKYEVKNYRYSKDYYYVFSKIIDKDTLLVEPHRYEKNMGVYIDIFPVDYVKNDIKYINNLMKRKKILDFIGSRPNKKNKIKFLLSSTLKFLIKPFRKIILKKIDYDSIQSSSLKYCEQVVYASIAHNPIEDKNWEGLIKINFEDIKVNSIKKYDLFLRQIYGEYMTLPPEKERVGHHSYKVYWKDK